MTIHNINEKWTLKPFTLSCVDHVGKNKADDILLDLSNVWTYYNLDLTNMVGVVTDTAPVMGAFGRQLPGVVPHFFCVDHEIELTTVNNVIDFCVVLTPVNFLLQICLLLFLISLFRFFGIYYRIFFH